MLAKIYNMFFKSTKEDREEWMLYIRTEASLKELEEFKKDLEAEIALRKVLESKEPRP